MIPMLSLLTMFGMVIHMFIENLRNSAVKGSRQRYMYTTLRIIVHYVTIFLVSCNTIIYIVTRGDVLFNACYLHLPHPGVQ